MTLEEYNTKVNEIGERLRTEWDDDLYDELNDFQYNYMQEVLDEYKKSKKWTPARQCCYELLYHAVWHSESGSSIQYVNSKKLADEVDDIIWDELGDYMLDSPEIYKVKDQWAISCMFGGNYVPCWDGWRD